MRDERRQQLVEQYEEMTLSLLMDEYAETEGARLLQEYEELERNGEVPEIPADLDEKCKGMIDAAFKKQKRGLWLKQTGKFVARAAVVTLVLLGISTVTVLSVDAFRIPVLNFLMDQDGRYSTVVYSEEAIKETDTANSTVMRFESSLPMGYTVVQKNIGDRTAFIRCVNASNSIIRLEITKTGSGLSVDTEDTEFVDQEFGDYPAVFKNKNGYHLMWLGDDQTVYTLFANGLSIDEFWELAYATAG